MKVFPASTLWSEGGFILERVLPLLVITSHFAWEELNTKKVSKPALSASLDELGTTPPFLVPCQDNLSECGGLI